MMDVKARLSSFIKGLKFDKTFLIDLEQESIITYQEFFCAVIAMAEQLKKYDTDRIFISLENSVLLVKLYFASIFCNKLIAVADPQKGMEVINDIRMEQGDCIAIIDTHGIQEGLGIFDDIHFNKEIVKDEVLKTFENVDLNCDYLITYTSGTEGLPKGVVHSLKNLFETAFSIIEKMEVPDSGTYLHIMPMTYMAGILNSIIQPFIMGYSIVISARFSVRTAAAFWKIVSKYNVNLLWIAPAMLLMIDKMDRSDFGEKYCRDHEICFLVGTAALTENIRIIFRERYGVELLASYGLSEVLFVSVETRKSRALYESGNVGELLSGVEFRVETDGELLIHVPWIFHRYTNTDIDKYFRNKFYCTGDLGTYEEVLYITGRKKDLIIKGGLNISPSIIEQKVSGTGMVLENAVFAIESKRGDELVCCCYVPMPGTWDMNLEADLQAAVIGILGSEYRIDCFFKVRELPRNINGKIDKEVLKGQYEQRA